ncbi:uroporphyrinogen decarboxylase family protein [Chloroflexota bacterium]
MEVTDKKWQSLSWEEKREERFKRWLDSPQTKFVSPEAEKLYKERVTRFIKALKMEEPDRVPVMLPTGNFPAYYSGGSFHKMMYDYDFIPKAWTKYMDDFGDMDTFNAPGLVASGRISEAMDSRVTKLPGIGLPEDASMNQSVEGEYMYADEYDQQIMDPSDYYVRVMMPRTTGLFEPFKKLPPLHSIRGAAWVGIMADPEIRNVFQTLMDLTDDYEKQQEVQREVGKLILSRGYPSLRGGGPMAGAPFDHFADLLRGTRGIIMDMFRQPEKIHAAMEHRLNMLLETSIKNFPLTNSSPVVSMPLHKGDDMFMSDAQFEEFYWPYLRRVCMAMVEEGLIPMPFAEGMYTNRLKQIADTPKSAVAWYFDQTDMAEAKKILGNVCCIVGNVPTGVVIKGTPQEVKEYCRKLIETCAPGGGYILSGGASIDKGNIPNLKAMMEAAYEYGVYKK